MSSTYPVLVTSAFVTRTSEGYEVSVHAGEAMVCAFLQPDAEKAGALAKLLQDAPVLRARVFAYFSPRAP